MKSSSLIPVEILEKRIFLIRNQKVMLDKDLAELYQIPTKVLKQAVRRNLNRFPADFMFVLNKDEKKQLVTNCDRLNTLKHSSVNPLVFTEQGVAMLSTVLNSERAVQVNIEIMRVFVKLREIISTHKDLARKLEELEKKYDTKFRVVFDALRELMKPAEKEKKSIGFLVKEPRAKYLPKYK
jgi:hypothetical protein